MAASSSSRLAAALLVAGAAIAGAQERERLPIQVTARSSDFDYQKGVFKFDSIAITQGGVRITADQAVASGVDFKDSSWDFSGTVRISMPESELASETARVRFSAGEIASAAVTGTPATFEQQHKEQHAEGRANRIDYDLMRGTVDLIGEAWLSDGKTEITGGKLVYSTLNQRVVSQEQVLITIQPGAAPETAPKPKP